MQHQLIERTGLMAKLAVCCKEAPITVLLGARQVGKTTLAQMFCNGRQDVSWFDLETTLGIQSLSAMPEKTLAEKKGLVVIDDGRTDTSAGRRT